MSDTKLPEVDPTSYHMVVYTDGGAQPSRGHCGFGFHAYLHTRQTPKQGAGAKSIPTADGYEQDKKKAVEVVQYVDLIEPIDHIDTNNVAELMAAIRAFEYAAENDVLSLVVLMDSKYVMLGLEEYLPAWIRNGWTKADGQPVANKELWETLVQCREALDAKAIPVTLKHVKGHSGDLGNNMADEHATKAILRAKRKLYEPMLIESPAKGYWKQDADYNRMLSKSCWYFNTNVDVGLCASDGRMIYHQGSEDSMWGKRIAKAHFSVVFLKNAEEPLEVVRKRQNEISDGITNAVIIGRLDNILLGRTYMDIETYGDLHLYATNAKRDLGLQNAEGMPITMEKRPARLAYVAIESMVNMENTLEDFIGQQTQVAEGKTQDDLKAAFKGRYLSITDITDSLFLTSEKKGKVKCELHKTIGVSAKEIRVTLDYDTQAAAGSLEHALLLDMDLPSRNALSALASRCPKVYAITWRESDTAFRYATVVEAGDDIGIWSSIYSNLRLLP